MGHKLPSPLFKHRSALSYSNCERHLIGAMASSTRFFDPRTFEETIVFPKAKGVIGAVFLPGDEHVVLAEYMHSAGVYRIEDGKLVGKKWSLVEKPLDVVAFLSIPDSEEILHASWDGPPRIIDYSGNLVRRIGGRKGGAPTKAVAFSPSGDKLAVATDAALWIYDWPDEVLVQKVDVFSDMERNTDSSRHANVGFATSSRIIVGNQEGHARLFDFTTNQLSFEFSFERECNYQRSFVFDREKHVVAFQDGGALRFYNFELLECLGSVTFHKEYTEPTGISPRHGTLSVGVGDAGGGRIFRIEDILRILDS